MNVVVAGLGLIGGSIAKSLKLNTDCAVWGIDLNEDVLLDACSCGAIDGKAGLEEVRNADVVYLCLYPEAALTFAREYGPEMKEGSVLTDVCGVKREICAGMEKLTGTGRYAFVAGHPMAGREKSGFSMSDASIFIGASYIIVPCGAPDRAVETVAGLARRMGFGKIVYSTPEQHDRVIAFTSQAPHVLACAYVKSPRCREHHGFSAGSYRDVSRVADINGELWSGLFLDNRDALTEELDELVRSLTLYRDAIAAGDRDRLRALLDEAAQIKREEG